MPSVKSCCFTGHRPSHLPWGEKENDIRCIQCKALLAMETEQAWRDGYRRFLCGMAIGADLMWAEAVLACQLVHPDTELVAVIPCENQTKGWPERQISRYQDILNCVKPQNRILVQQQRTRNCMLRRDRYMVGLSQRIIALYDGTSPGGTRYTLGYALERNLETVMIDPYSLEVMRN